MTNHPVANRLKKRFKHLKKWANRQSITCFRVYAKDLPEYPAVVDWVDGHAVAWLYDDDKKLEMIGAICQGLDIEFSQLFIKTRGKQKGLQTQYNKVADDTVIKTVKEGGLTFEVNLSDYLDIGLFLDHRPAREIIRSLSKDKKVLNLFAYTGSFTCYAIDGGATSTVTVDLNPNYCKWAQRNLTLNGWKEGNKHQVIVSDCMRYLNHCKDRFDIIVCDPPTFSNSKRGSTERFSVNHDYPQLLTACLNLLNPGGALLFSTNSTSFKLDPSQLPKGTQVEPMTHKTIPEDFKGSRIHQSWFLHRG